MWPSPQCSKHLGVVYIHLLFAKLYNNYNIVPRRTGQHISDRVTPREARNYRGSAPDPNSHQNRALKININFSNNVCACAVWRSAVDARTGVTGLPLISTRYRLGCAPSNYVPERKIRGLPASFLVLASISLHAYIQIVA